MESQRLSLGEHPLSDVAQAVRCHHVDGNAKQVLEVQFEPDEVEQGPALLELDQKIDVAVLAIVAARDRTEDAYIMPAVRFTQTENIGLFLVTQCVQR